MIDAVLSGSVTTSYWLNGNPAIGVPHKPGQRWRLSHPVTQDEALDGYMMANMDKLPTVEEVISRHPVSCVRLRYGLECGAGWFPLIDAMLTELDAVHASVVQIKEKFGGLRVYLDVGPGRAYDVIAEAERRAAVTCETCGAPACGVEKMLGATPVRCEEHR